MTGMQNVDATHPKDSHWDGPPDDPPSWTEKTWTCVMCCRALPKKGKAFYVGKPTVFLVCIDCWKGFVLRNAVAKEVLRGVRKWGKKKKKRLKGQRGPQQNSSKQIDKA